MYHLSAGPLSIAAVSHEGNHLHPVLRPLSPSAAEEEDARLVRISFHPRSAPRWWYKARPLVRRHSKLLTVQFPASLMSLPTRAVKVHLLGRWPVPMPVWPFSSHAESIPEVPKESYLLMEAMVRDLSSPQCRAILGLRRVWIVTLLRGSDGDVPRK